MRDLINLMEALNADEGDIELKLANKFKNPQGKLDYDGADFQSLFIMQDGRRIGEVVIQIGKDTVVVRNSLIFDDAMTGKGIGKKVYAKLASMIGNRKLRSSYSTNNAGGHQTTGLSDQAIAMWDSLVKSGKATRKTTKDGRFFYIAEVALPPATNEWSKKPYTVYENPTVEEFLGALDKSEANALRATLFDNGEILVWDSEAALHSDVDAAHGVSGGYNITIWFNHVDTQGNPKRDVLAALKKNPEMVQIGVTKLRMT